ncbi:MAG: lysophospholipid acyltransferase family protein [Dehalococcoidia bacterium]
MNAVVGWLFYWFTTHGLRVVLWVYSRWEVVGRKHIPRRGPAILAANHINMIDPPLLATCLRRRATFLGKAELFEIPFWGYLYKQYGAIPVHRHRADLAAVRQAVQALRKGHIVVTFPEGTRSRDARLARGHPGIAMIAMRSGAPVIPIAISGSEVVKLPGIFLRALVRRPKVRVVIGEPFYLPTSARARGEEIKQGTNIIMEQIAALLPEPYRGEYAYIGEGPPSASVERTEIPS